MTLEYQRHGKHIKINKMDVLLPAAIWQVLEYKNHALIVLDPDFGMRNVLCYGENGQLLWTIERPEFFKADGQGFFALEVSDFHDRKDALIAICRDRPFFLDNRTGKLEFIPGNFEK